MEPIVKIGSLLKDHNASYKVVAIQKNKVILEKQESPVVEVECCFSSVESMEIL